MGLVGDPRACMKTARAIGEAPVAAATGGARIFMITGLADLDVAGNQTLKNTIKYLAEFGHRVEVFSAFPEGHAGLQDPSQLFDGRVAFHRLPRVLGRLFAWGRRAKNWLNRPRRTGARRRVVAPGDEVRYYDEYSRAGRFLYVAFLFLFYLPLEILRVGRAHVLRRADLYYGVNGQGATVASLVGRLVRRPVVTRWFGSAIQERDLRSPLARLLMLDGTFALRLPCDVLIMANDGTRGDRVLRALDVDERRVRFWMNGVDETDLAAPSGEPREALKARLGLGGRRVILMTARLALWKRQDRGIAAMARLTRDFGVGDGVLLIVGEGPERARLEALTLDLGVREHVRFVGGVAHRRMGEYFAIADVFLTLADVSNLGNPVLEAMRFGLPIVTIDDGSTAELLEDGANAFLVARERVAAEVAERVRRLLDDEGLRREMGRRARETFSRKVLSWERRMRLEDEVICGLVGRNGARA